MKNGITLAIFFIATFTLPCCKNRFLYDESIKLKSKEGFIVHFDESFADEKISVIIKNEKVLDDISFPSDVNHERYVLIEEDLGDLKVVVAGKNYSEKRFIENKSITMRVESGKVFSEFEVNLRKGRFLNIRKHPAYERDKGKNQFIVNRWKIFWYRFFGDHEGKLVDDDLVIKLFQYPKATTED